MRVRGVPNMQIEKMKLARSLGLTLSFLDGQERKPRQTCGRNSTLNAKW